MLSLAHLSQRWKRLIIKRFREKIRPAVCLITAVCFSISGTGILPAFAGEYWVENGNLYMATSGYNPNMTAPNPNVVVPSFSVPTLPASYTPSTAGMDQADFCYFSVQDVNLATIGDFSITAFTQSGQNFNFNIFVQEALTALGLESLLPQGEAPAVSTNLVQPTTTLPDAGAGDTVPETVETVEGGDIAPDAQVPQVDQQVLDQLQTVDGMIGAYINGSGINPFDEGDGIDINPDDIDPVELGQTLSQAGADPAKVAEVLLSLTPDMAVKVANNMDPKALGAACQVMDPPAAAQLLVNVAPEVAVPALESMKPEQAAKVLGSIAQTAPGISPTLVAPTAATPAGSQAAANLLASMSGPSREAILKEMTTGDLTKILSSASSAQTNTILKSSSPGQAAQVLPTIPPANASNFLLSLDPAKAAEVLAQIPPDKAQVITASMTPEQVNTILSKATPEQLPKVLAAVDPKIAAAYISKLDPEVAVDILGDMPPQQAAGILGKMDGELAANLLMSMPVDQRNDIIMADKGNNYTNLAPAFSGMNAAELKNVLSTLDIKDQADVLANLPPSIAAAVLRQTDDPIVRNEILSYMPKDKAAAIQTEIDKQNTTPAVQPGSESPASGLKPWEKPLTEGYDPTTGTFTKKILNGDGTVTYKTYVGNDDTGTLAHVAIYGANNTPMEGWDYSQPDYPGGLHWVRDTEFVDKDGVVHQAKGKECVVEFFAPDGSIVKWDSYDTNGTLVESADYTMPVGNGNTGVLIRYIYGEGGMTMKMSDINVMNANEGSTTAADDAVFGWVRYSAVGKKLVAVEGFNQYEKTGNGDDQGVYWVRDGTVASYYASDTASPEGTVFKHMVYSDNTADAYVVSGWDMYAEVGETGQHGMMWERVDLGNGNYAMCYYHMDPTTKERGKCFHAETYDAKGREVSGWDLYAKATNGTPGIVWVVTYNEKDGSSKKTFFHMTPGADTKTTGVEDKQGQMYYWVEYDAFGTETGSWNAYAPEVPDPVLALASADYIPLWAQSAYYGPGATAAGDDQTSSGSTTLPLWSNTTGVVDYHDYQVGSYNFTDVPGSTPKYNDPFLNALSSLWPGMPDLSTPQGWLNLLMPFVAPGANPAASSGSPFVVPTGTQPKLPLTLFQPAGSGTQVYQPLPTAAMPSNLKGSLFSGVTERSEGYTTRMVPIKNNAGDVIRTERVVDIKIDGSTASVYENGTVMIDLKGTDLTLVVTPGGQMLVLDKDGMVMPAATLKTLPPEQYAIPLAKFAAAAEAQGNYELAAVAYNSLAQYALATGNIGSPLAPGADVSATSYGANATAYEFAAKAVSCAQRSGSTQVFAQASITLAEVYAVNGKVDQALSILDGITQMLAADTTLSPAQKADLSLRTIQDAKLMSQKVPALGDVADLPWYQQAVSLVETSINSLVATDPGQALSLAARLDAATVPPSNHVDGVTQKIVGNLDVAAVKAAFAAGNQYYIDPKSGGIIRPVEGGGYTFQLNAPGSQINVSLSLTPEGKFKVDKAVVFNPDTRQPRQAYENLDGKLTMTTMTVDMAVTFPGGTVLVKPITINVSGGEIQKAVMLHEGKIYQLIMDTVGNKAVAKELPISEGVPAALAAASSPDSSFRFNAAGNPESMGSGTVIVIPKITADHLKDSGLSEDAKKALIGRTGYQTADGTIFIGDQEGIATDGNYTVVGKNMLMPVGGGEIKPVNYVAVYVDHKLVSATLSDGRRIDFKNGSTTDFTVTSTSGVNGERVAKSTYEGGKLVRTSVTLTNIGVTLEYDAQGNITKECLAQLRATKPDANYKFTELASGGFVLESKTNSTRETYSAQGRRVIASEAGESSGSQEVVEFDTFQSQTFNFAQYNNRNGQKVTVLDIQKNVVVVQVGADGTLTRTTTRSNVLGDSAVQSIDTWVVDSETPKGAWAWTMDRKEHTLTAADITALGLGPDAQPGGVIVLQSTTKGVWTAEGAAAKNRGEQGAHGMYTLQTNGTWKWDRDVKTFTVTTEADRAMDVDGDGKFTATATETGKWVAQGVANQNAGDGDARGVYEFNSQTKKWEWQQDLKSFVLTDQHIQDMGLNKNLADGQTPYKAGDTITAQSTKAGEWTTIGDSHVNQTDGDAQGIYGYNSKTKRWEWQSDYKMHQLTAADITTMGLDPAKYKVKDKITLQSTEAGKWTAMGSAFANKGTQGAVGVYRYENGKMVWDRDLQERTVAAGEEFLDPDGDGKYTAFSTKAGEWLAMGKPASPENKDVEGAFGVYALNAKTNTWESQGDYRTRTVTQNDIDVLGENIGPDGTKARVGVTEITLRYNTETKQWTADGKAGANAGDPDAVGIWVLNSDNTWTWNCDYKKASVNLKIYPPSEYETRADAADGTIDGKYVVQSTEKGVWTTTAVFQDACWGKVTESYQYTGSGLTLVYVDAHEGYLDAHNIAVEERKQARDGKANGIGWHTVINIGEQYWGGYEEKIVQYEVTYTDTFRHYKVNIGTGPDGPRNSLVGKAIIEGVEVTVISGMNGKNFEPQVVIGPPDILKNADIARGLIGMYQEGKGRTVPVDDPAFIAKGTTSQQITYVDSKGNVTLQLGKTPGLVGWIATTSGKVNVVATEAKSGLAAVFGNDIAVGNWSGTQEAFAAAGLAKKFFDNVKNINTDVGGGIQAQISQNGVYSLTRNSDGSWAVNATFTNLPEGMDVESMGGVLDAKGIIAITINGEVKAQVDPTREGRLNMGVLIADNAPKFDWFTSLFIDTSFNQIVIQNTQMNQMKTFDFHGDEKTALLTMRWNLTIEPVAQFWAMMDVIRDHQLTYDKEMSNPNISFWRAMELEGQKLLDGIAVIGALMLIPLQEAAAPFVAAFHFMANNFWRAVPDWTHNILMSITGGVETDFTRGFEKAVSAYAALEYGICKFIANNFIILVMVTASIALMNPTILASLGQQALALKAIIGFTGKIFIYGSGMAGLHQGLLTGLSSWVYNFWLRDAFDVADGIQAIKDALDGGLESPDDYFKVADAFALFAGAALLAFFQFQEYKGWVEAIPGAISKVGIKLGDFKMGFESGGLRAGIDAFRNGIGLDNIKPGTDTYRAAESVMLNTDLSRTQKLEILRDLNKPGADIGKILGDSGMKWDGTGVGHMDFGEGSLGRGPELGKMGEVVDACKADIDAARADMTKNGRVTTQSMIFGGERLATALDIMGATLGSIGDAKTMSAAYQQVVTSKTFSADGGVNTSMAARVYEGAAKMEASRLSQSAAQPAQTGSRLIADGLQKAGGQAVMDATARSISGDAVTARSLLGQNTMGETMNAKIMASGLASESAPRFSAEISKSQAAVNNGMDALAKANDTRSMNTAMNTAQDIATGRTTAGALSVTREQMARPMEAMMNAACTNPRVMDGMLSALKGENLREGNMRADAAKGMLDMAGRSETVRTQLAEGLARDKSGSAMRTFAEQAKTPEARENLARTAGSTPEAAKQFADVAKDLYKGEELALALTKIFPDSPRAVERILSAMDEVDPGRFDKLTQAMREQHIPDLMHKAGAGILRGIEVSLKDLGQDAKGQNLIKALFSGVERMDDEKLAQAGGDVKTDAQAGPADGKTPQAPEKTEPAKQQPKGLLGRAADGIANLASRAVPQSLKNQAQNAVDSIRDAMDRMTRPERAASGNGAPIRNAEDYRNANGLNGRSAWHQNMVNKILQAANPSEASRLALPEIKPEGTEARGDQTAAPKTEPAAAEKTDTPADEASMGERQPVQAPFNHNRASLQRADNFFDLVSHPGRLAETVLSYASGHALIVGALNATVNAIAPNRAAQGPAQMRGAEGGETGATRGQGRQGVGVVGGLLLPGVGLIQAIGNLRSRNKMSNGDYVADRIAKIDRGIAGMENNLGRLAQQRMDLAAQKPASGFEAWQMRRQANHIMNNIKEQLQMRSQVQGLRQAFVDAGRMLAATQTTNVQADQQRKLGPEMAGRVDDSPMGRAIGKSLELEARLDEAKSRFEAAQQKGEIGEILRTSTEVDQARSALDRSRGRLSDEAGRLDSSGRQSMAKTICDGVPNIQPARAHELDRLAGMQNRRSIVTQRIESLNKQIAAAQQQSASTDAAKVQRQAGQVQTEAAAQEAAKPSLQQLEADKAKQERLLAKLDQEILRTSGEIIGMDQRPLNAIDLLGLHHEAAMQLATMRGAEALEMAAQVIQRAQTVETRQNGHKVSMASKIMEDIAQNQTLGGRTKAAQLASRMSSESLQMLTRDMSPETRNSIIDTIQRTANHPFLKGQIGQAQSDLIAARERLDILQAQGKQRLDSMRERGVQGAALDSAARKVDAGLERPRREVENSRREVDRLENRQRKAQDAVLGMLEGMDRKSLIGDRPGEGLLGQSPSLRQMAAESGSGYLKSMAAQAEKVIMDQPRRAAQAQTTAPGKVNTAQTMEKLVAEYLQGQSGQEAKPRMVQEQNFLDFARQKGADPNAIDALRMAALDEYAKGHPEMGNAVQAFKAFMLQQPAGTRMVDALREFNKLQADQGKAGISLEAMLVTRARVLDKVSSTSSWKTEARRLDAFGRVRDLELRVDQARAQQQFGLERTYHRELVKARADLRKLDPAMVGKGDPLPNTLRTVATADVFRKESALAIAIELKEIVENDLYTKAEVTELVKDTWEKIYKPIYENAVANGQLEKYQESVKYLSGRIKEALAGTRVPTQMYQQFMDLRSQMIKEGLKAGSVEDARLLRLYGEYAFTAITGYKVAEGATTAMRFSQRMMVSEFFGGFNVGLRAGGGKTIPFIMFPALVSMMGGEAVRAEILVDDPAACAKYIGEMLGNSGFNHGDFAKAFGIELVNGNEVYARAQKTGNFSELIQALKDPRRVVIFDHTTRAHLRNAEVSNVELRKALGETNLVGIDEVHMAATSQTSAIIGGNVSKPDAGQVKKVDALLEDLGLSMDPGAYARQALKQLLSSPNKTTTLGDYQVRDLRSQGRISDAEWTALNQSPQKLILLTQQGVKLNLEARAALKAHDAYTISSTLRTIFSQPGKAGELSSYAVRDGYVYPVNTLGKVETEQISNDIVGQIVASRLNNLNPFDSVRVNETKMQTSLSAMYAGNDGARIVGASATIAGLGDLMMSKIGSESHHISTSLLDIGKLIYQTGGEVITSRKAGHEITMRHLASGDNLLIFDSDPVAMGDEVARILKHSEGREIGQLVGEKHVFGVGTIGAESVGFHMRQGEGRAMMELLVSLADASAKKNADSNPSIRSQKVIIDEKTGNAVRITEYADSSRQPLREVLFTGPRAENVNGQKYEYIQLLADPIQAMVDFSNKLDNQAYIFNEQAAVGKNWQNKFTLMAYDVHKFSSDFVTQMFLRSGRPQPSGVSWATTRYAMVKVDEMISTMKTAQERLGEIKELGLWTDAQIERVGTTLETARNWTQLSGDAKKAFLQAALELTNEFKQIELIGDSTRFAVQDTFKDQIVVSPLKTAMAGLAEKTPGYRILESALNKVLDQKESGADIDIRLASKNSGSEINQQYARSTFFTNIQQARGVWWGVLKDTIFSLRPKAWASGNIGMALRNLGELYRASAIVGEGPGLRSLFNNFMARVLNPSAIFQKLPNIRNEEEAARLRPTTFAGAGDFAGLFLIGDYLMTRVMSRDEGGLSAGALEYQVARIMETNKAGEQVEPERMEEFKSAWENAHQQVRGKDAAAATEALHLSAAGENRRYTPELITRIAMAPTYQQALQILQANGLTSAPANGRVSFTPAQPVASAMANLGVSKLGLSLRNNSIVGPMLRNMDQRRIEVSRAVSQFRADFAARVSKKEPMDQTSLARAFGADWTFYQQAQKLMGSQTPWAGIQLWWLTLRQPAHAQQQYYQLLQDARHLETAWQQNGRGMVYHFKGQQMDYEQTRAAIEYYTRLAQDLKDRYGFKTTESRTFQVTQTMQAFMARMEPYMPLLSSLLKSKTFVATAIATTTVVVVLGTAGFSLTMLGAGMAMGLASKMLWPVIQSRLPKMSQTPGMPQAPANPMLANAFALAPGVLKLDPGMAVGALIGSLVAEVISAVRYRRAHPNRRLWMNPTEVVVARADDVLSKPASEEPQAEEATFYGQWQDELKKQAQLEGQSTDEAAVEAMQAVWQSQGEDKQLQINPSMATKGWMRLLAAGLSMMPERVLRSSRLKDIRLGQAQPGQFSLPDSRQAFDQQGPELMMRQLLEIASQALWSQGELEALKAQLLKLAEFEPSLQNSPDALLAYLETYLWRGEELRLRNQNLQWEAEQAKDPEKQSQAQAALEVSTKVYQTVQEAFGREFSALDRDRIALAVSERQKELEAAMERDLDIYQGVESWERQRLGWEFRQTYGLSVDEFMRSRRIPAGFKLMMRLFPQGMKNQPVQTVLGLVQRGYVLSCVVGITAVALVGLAAAPALAAATGLAALIGLTATLALHAQSRGILQYAQPDYTVRQALAHAPGKAFQQELVTQRMQGAIDLLAAHSENPWSKAQAVNLLMDEFFRLAARVATDERLTPAQRKQRLDYLLKDCMTALGVPMRVKFKDEAGLFVQASPKLQPSASVLQNRRLARLKDMLAGYGVFIDIKFEVPTRPWKQKWVGASA